ncbi:MAG: prolipoprotein diacylglyceryl transferase [Acidimicrobiia bacterium]|nr:prolipoprotein diacylglyceryl transferase [Acidimicrobiia bacterium]
MAGHDRRLMEFTLLAAAMLGVAAAVGWLAVMHHGDAELRASTRDLIVIGALAGIVTGRIWAMIAGGTNPITHPVDVFMVRGGVDPFAASLAAVAAAGWSGRHEGWTLIDAAAPGAVMGLAGWHAGCLVRNACLGSTTELPWGWATTPGTAARHPVELYAAALLVLVALAVTALWRRGTGGGLATTVAVASAAGVRAVTEPLRPVLGEGRTLGYAIAAVTAAGFAGVLWWRKPTADS